MDGCFVSGGDSSVEYRFVIRIAEVRNGRAEVRNVLNGKWKMENGECFFGEGILLAKRFGILEPKAPGEGPKETE
jgi:hypothetical protein